MNHNTSKKLKVIGTEQYVNQSTGNVEDFQVIRVEDADTNFDKFWISQILTAIDEFGNQKMRLLMYLISKRERSNNAVIKTTRELAEETGISRNTILQTLKILEGHGIIWRKTGVIFVSPNVIFRGSHQKRMRVILDYGKPAEHIEAEPEQEQPEPKPKIKPINLKDVPGLAVKKSKAEKRIRAAA